MSQDMTFLIDYNTYEFYKHFITSFWRLLKI